MTTVVVIINPMLYLYTLAYRYNTWNVIAEYISGCKNQMTLAELEELAEEENEEDA